MLILPCDDCIKNCACFPYRVVVSADDAKDLRKFICSILGCKVSIRVDVKEQSGDLQAFAAIQTTSMSINLLCREFLNADIDVRGTVVVVGKTQSGDLRPLSMEDGETDLIGPL